MNKMIPGDIARTRRIARCLLWLFVGVTTFAVLVPLTPRFPEGGLDPSWQFALNQAIVQGLVFGRDVIQ